MKIDIDALAQEIRRVDGSNSLGAGALAEALVPFLSRTPANPTPPGWPDPLESPQAEAIRNGKLDDTEIRNLFDTMERELRLHRERAAIGAGGQAVAEPADWIWYGEDEVGQHITFGRWQKFPCQKRYKLAEIQPTEHDHPAPSGQAVAVAVAVKALEEIEADIKELDALPPSIQSQRNIRIINAFNRTRSALSNPPAQPGWRDMERDAERWNALLRCARIRMQGSAGFDPKTGERQEYSNSTGKYTKGDTSGWVHFGAEFWSVYPGAEDYEGHNQWGRHALTALADDVLLKARQAIPAAPLPGGAK